MLSRDQRFSCNGEVTEWQYVAKQSHGFRAIVWRQMDSTATTFFVVGINDIPAGPINTPVTYKVPEFERIRVKVGDMIGWSFGDGVLAFDIGGDHSVRWLGGNLHSSIQLNSVLQFDDGAGNREYSIAAKVAETSELGEWILYSMHKLHRVLLILTSLN